MKQLAFYILVFVLFSTCTSKTEFSQETITVAIGNGQQANAGFERSLHFTKAWLTKTDSFTGLIPTNLTNKTDVWEPHNSAADNYVFMVLTAYLLDKNLYKGELQVMFAMQQENGIIGGWHGDGNFARTAIMYSLWKTQGATIQPWRSDVNLGAENTGDEIYFVLTAENDWEGKLVFDAPRYKTMLKLPVDYPRINQFPEWFTVERENEYSVISSKKDLSGKYSGTQLLEGIPVQLKAGDVWVARLPNRAF
ncbi:MAG: hypothetical protein K0B11_22370 [Mariniphaga sp.]|nr:hypothetical protein [Mariniphaga sp.]